MHAAVAAVAAESAGEGVSSKFDCFQYHGRKDCIFHSGMIFLGFVSESLLDLSFSKPSSSFFRARVSS